MAVLACVVAFHRALMGWQRCDTDGAISVSHSSDLPYTRDDHGGNVVQGAWTILDHWQQQHPEAAGSSAAAADHTAVVAALSFWDYSLLYDGTAGEAYQATGRCFSVAAGRISYVYGLKGIMGLTPSA